MWKLLMVEWWRFWLWLDAKWRNPGFSVTLRHKGGGVFEVLRTRSFRNKTRAEKLAYRQEQERERDRQDRLNALAGIENEEERVSRLREAEK